MKIGKAKLRLDGEDGVTVTRTVINDQGLRGQSWAEVITNGVPQAKPNADIFGDDHGIQTPTNSQ